MKKKPVPSNQDTQKNNTDEEYGDNLILSSFEQGMFPRKINSDTNYSNFFKGLVWGIAFSIPLWIIIFITINSILIRNVL